jgi:ELP3 family radical SAM enzyme/protein acetyltransferase
MNTDIEDFILTKNRVGSDDHNNFDASSWDISACKKIFIHLLEWLEANKDSLNIANNNQLNKKFEGEFNKQIRLSKIPGLRKSVLLNIFNNLIVADDFASNIHLQEYFPHLKLLLRKRPMRNISGITSITVITAPFPDGQKFSCKHNCYYCPNEPAHKDNGWQAQPRSYLFHEPAVLRANQHKFYAIGQMLNRMDTYFCNGHVIDKLEIIVEGGTYTEYPVDYLERYHRDLFYAANIYFDLRRAYPNYDNCLNNKLDLSTLSLIRQPLSVEEEIRINKTAKVHIIGICIETRPDALDDDWLMRFRKWGVTRVQLGAQHVDNRILKKINRGHTIEQLLWAMQYLKDNCFKIDIHIMPDLPGATPEIDRKMFDYVYSVVCPDQMKVYPCQTVPWTVIKKWYDRGEYVPYFDTDPKLLIDVVRYSMETCPKWVRLPRVIRDIPCSVYVEGGNNIGNMRQVVDNLLDGEGIISQDIRAREIGRHSKYYDKPGCYNIYNYSGNGGDDYFIAYESFDLRALFGFIRLRFVDPLKNMTRFDILNGRGLVRELHVYGDTTAVNASNKNGCQHTGIGGGLLRLAERKTMEQGLGGIVVISGEGVKGYYEKNGYREIDTFMVKDFSWWKVWFYYLFGQFRLYRVMVGLTSFVVVVAMLMVRGN